jgi:hypothetical protein
MATPTSDNYVQRKKGLRFQSISLGGQNCIKTGVKIPLKNTPVHRLQQIVDGKRAYSLARLEPLDYK